MPSKPRRAQLPTPFVVPGMEAKTLEFRSIEDEHEKTQRLRKEMLSFYVKDLQIWIIGCLFVLLTGLYCFWVLMRVESQPVDRDRAWSAVMAILGGIVGLLFGKVAK